MMKISVLNLFIVCCVMLSLVSACDSGSGSEHPSDATLEKNFYAHEADLSLLAQMASEDADMTLIGPTSTWHKDSTYGPDSKAKYGFSDERYEQYKQLLSRLGTKNGIFNHQPNQMLVAISSSGSITRISSKGYAYLPEKPAELRESLDKVIFEDYRKSYNIAYKHLKGNWYLYYRIT